MDFKTWELTAESKKTLEVNRDVIRDIYPMPNGIDLMQDVCMPRNPFGKTWEKTVVCYTLPNTEKEHVEKAGGELSDDYYTEDGYGTAVFKGDDSMEKAFNFGMTLNYSKTAFPLGSI